MARLVEVPMECLRAIMGDSENCRGEVTTRITNHGMPIDECEFHMSQSLKRNQEINERYPDSPIAPPWFDETIAGERWNDDY